MEKVGISAAPQIIPGHVVEITEGWDEPEQALFGYGDELDIPEAVLILEKPHDGGGCVDIGIYYRLASGISIPNELAGIDVVCLIIKRRQKLLAEPFLNPALVEIRIIQSGVCVTGQKPWIESEIETCSLVCDQKRLEGCSHSRAYFPVF